MKKEFQTHQSFLQHHPQQDPEVKVPFPCNSTSTYPQRSAKKQGFGTLGEEDRHERRRAREARGRQTHLDASTRLRVTPKEHPGRWRRSEKHYAGHEGQQQREQGGPGLAPNGTEQAFRAPATDTFEMSKNSVQFYSRVHTKSPSRI